MYVFRALTCVVHCAWPSSFLSLSLLFRKEQFIVTRSLYQEDRAILMVEYDIRGAL